MPSIVVIATVLMASAIGSPWCPGAPKGNAFEWRVLGPSDEKEPPLAGTLAKSFVSEAGDWIERCPNDESVWYAFLRAKELVSTGGPTQRDLQSARTAVSNSPWIETIWARSVGTVEAAKAVASLAPHHRPALVALADAYRRAGDPTAAVRVLRPIKDLASMVGAPILLAQSALAIGDVKLAAEAAHLEPDSAYGLVEPVSGNLRVAEARVLEATARFQLGEAEKAVLLLADAEAWGSADAETKLGSPTVAMRLGIQAVLRRSNLDADTRRRLSEHIGLHLLGLGELRQAVRYLVMSEAMPNSEGKLLRHLCGSNPKVLDELRIMAKDRFELARVSWTPPI